jgi:hypothetical protein
VLIAVFAVFVIPIIASYAVFRFWPPQGRMNYGELIEPRPLAHSGLRRLDGAAFGLGELKGRWVLVQIDAAACTDSCRRKLHHMRQVRLAQGRNMDRIERLWLVRDHGPVEPALLRQYDGTHVARAGSGALPVLPAERDAADHIYVIDPLGNLMLRFPNDADPSRMKKDLERLLKMPWRPLPN